MMTRLSGENAVRSVGSERRAMKLRRETVDRGKQWGRRFMDSHWGKGGITPWVSRAFRHCAWSAGETIGPVGCGVTYGSGRCSEGEKKKKRGKSEWERGAKLSEVAQCWSNCLIVLKPFCRSVTPKEGSSLCMCVVLLKALQATRILILHEVEREFTTG